jgi:hypothetical protein
MMGEKERQRRYRERMYDAGFKQVLVWVPEKVAGKFKSFIESLDLTSKWSRKKLTGLLDNLIQIVETTKEDKKK